MTDVRSAEEKNVFRLVSVCKSRADPGTASGQNISFHLDISYGDGDRAYSEIKELFGGGEQSKQLSEFLLTWTDI